MKNNIKKKIKENKGFTLVEALIAIIILAVVSVVMVQGVSMARKAYSSNKMKTEASAIANQEIEKIRSMPYIDVGLIGGDPSGLLNAQKTTSTEYSVEYSVNWAEDTHRTKRIKVSVFKSPMANKFEVITEITPLGEILASENSTVNAPTGGLIITKVAVGGLTGTFNFVVKNSGGTVSSPSITISSGETNKSTAPITGLTPGTYIVTETSTGAFSTVSVPSSGSVPVVAGQNAVITFTNTNAPTGGLIITKVAVGGLTGTFNFVVKNSGGTVSSPSITISSGETNKSTAPITGLTPGTYIVTETLTGSFSTISNPSSGSVLIVAGQNAVITFTNTPTLQYPKPSGLIVISDHLQGNNRTVTLQWQRPNTTLTIIKYNIYRNNFLLIKTITSDLQTVIYSDTDFNNWDSNQYTYFIKAVYLGNILGQRSDEVVTSPN